MPFVCPQCASPGCLRIVHRLELPPDARSDEITLQIVACSRCGFKGIAVYEESRRGSLDSEAVDHVGYRVSTDDVAELQRAISQCPEPGNPRCSCPVHRRYGRRDGWMDLGLGETFALVL